MAQKLLQHALQAEAAPLNKFEVVSAGVAAAYGDPASANSVAALKKVKLDLSTHISQPLTPALTEKAFAIFGMTQSHLDILAQYYDGLPQHVHLFRGFIDAPNHEIPDPYGQNLEAYTDCLDSMIEAIPSLIKFLRSLNLPASN